MKAYHDETVYSGSLKVLHESYYMPKTSAHWHRDMEIACVLEGSCEFFINDQSFIAEKGTLVFVDMNLIHSYNSLTPGTLVDFLFFDPSYISPHYQGMFVPLFHVDANTPSHDGLFEVWQHLLSAIDQELKFTDYYSPRILSSEIRLFLYRAGRSLYTPGETHPQRSSPKHTQEFNEIITYINDHYNEKLSLPAVSAKMGFSQSHFSRMFKEKTGLGFSKYLNLVRITNAAEMLVNGRGKMVDISEACGFESVRNFNRVFSEIAGCTPTEYLKAPFMIQGTFKYLKSTDKNM